MTARKITAALLSIFICISLSINIFAQSVPGKEGYVSDAANVLSQTTEEQVAQIATELKDSCGVDLAVLTQRNVEGSMKEFSTEVFEHWGLNSRGALLVLSLQNQSYYLILGTVAQENFTQTDINNMLLDDLEPYFAQENYDAGVIAICESLQKEMTELYYEEPEVSETPKEEKKSSGFVEFLKGLVKFILILAAMVALVVGFIYARSEYIKIRRIRHQRREEILTGTAPSSYVPAEKREYVEPEEEAKPQEKEESWFPSYNFDESFKLDMDRDLSTPDDPETKEYDIYKTHSSTKYDFETFSKRK